MGLPKQPDVVVRIPGAIFVGERVVAEIEVEARKQTKLDFIDVRIQGTQRWTLGSSQHGSAGTEIVFPSLAKRVMEAGVLEPGSHAFSVAFALPPGTPPTHEISPARARLTFEVHASIPWWPDGRYRFTLPVRLPPPATAQRTPRSVRVPYEAAGDEPRIEVALASSTLVAGETVLGSCAVFHLDDSEPRELDVSFEPYLLLQADGRQHVRWGDGYRTTVTLPAGSAGTAMPLRIGLPLSVTPSFSCATHELQWFMKVKCGSLFSKRLEAIIPIVVLDARAAGDLPALTLVPRLADERALVVFEGFARERGLDLIRHELDEFAGEQPAVVRETERDELRVGYAYRGKDGTFLVGRVRYAALGLGLSVLPSSALRELFSDDIELGLADWDRIHRVDARDPAQAVPFLREIVPTPRIGTLVRWTDDEIVFECSVATVAAEDLAGMVLGLELVADAIAWKRSLIRPPTGVTADLGAWHLLANRLGGPLCVGDLSISGKLDTTAVDLGLVFEDDRDPIAMRVYVGDPVTASPRAREVSLSVARPATQAGSVTPARVSALLASWSPDVINLELVKGVAAASLPLDAGGADATRVRELIRALQALLGALDENAGPYR